MTMGHFYRSASTADPNIGGVLKDIIIGPSSYGAERFETFSIDRQSGRLPAGTPAAVPFVIAAHAPENLGGVFNLFQSTHSAFTQFKLSFEYCFVERTQDYAFTDIDEVRINLLGWTGSYPLTWTTTVTRSRNETNPYTFYAGLAPKHYCFTIVSVSSTFLDDVSFTDIVVSATARLKGDISLESRVVPMQPSSISAVYRKMQQPRPFLSSPSPPPPPSPNDGGLSPTTGDAGGSSGGSVDAPPALENPGGQGGGNVAPGGVGTDNIPTPPAPTVSDGAASTGPNNNNGNGNGNGNGGAVVAIGDFVTDPGLLLSIRDNIAPTFLNCDKEITFLTTNGDSNYLATWDHPVPVDNVEVKTVQWRMLNALNSESGAKGVSDGKLKDLGVEAIGTKAQATLIPALSPYTAVYYVTDRIGLLGTCQLTIKLDYLAKTLTTELAMRRVVASDGSGDIVRSFDSNQIGSSVYTTDLYNFDNMANPFPIGKPWGDSNRIDIRLKPATKDSFKLNVPSSARSVLEVFLVGVSAGQEDQERIAQIVSGGYNSTTTIAGQVSVSFESVSRTPAFTDGEAETVLKPAMQLDAATNRVCTVSSSKCINGDGFGVGSQESQGVFSLNEDRIMVAGEFALQPSVYTFSSLTISLLFPGGVKHMPWGSGNVAYNPFFLSRVRVKAFYEDDPMQLRSETELVSRSSLFSFLDKTAPVFTSCPTDIVTGTDEGMAWATVSWDEPQATDNFAVNTMQSSHKSGSKFGIGATKVTVTALDQGLNSAACSFEVRVRDYEKPRVKCAPSLIDNVAADQAGRVIVSKNAYMPANPWDNSGFAEVILPVAGTVSFRLSDMGRTHREISSSVSPYRRRRREEASSASASATTTIAPATPTAATTTAAPVAASVATTTIAPATPKAATTTAPVAVAVSTLPPVFPEYALPDGYEPRVGTDVIVRVSDSALNEFACYYKLNVTDAYGPTIENCPADIEARKPGRAVVMWTLPKANDNGGESQVTLSASHQPGTEFQGGTTVVKYSAVDRFRNREVNECSFKVTVPFDTEPPQFVNSPCQPDVQVEAPSDNGATVQYGPPSVTDNADDRADLTFEEDVGSGSLFAVGSNLVTQTVTDTSNNAAQCQFWVNVTAPSGANTLGSSQIAGLESNTFIGIIGGSAGFLLLLTLALILRVRRTREKPASFEEIMAQLSTLHDDGHSMNTPQEVPRDSVRIIETIGKGNFGSVDKAMYTEKRTHGVTVPAYVVAVKTLHDPSAAARQELLEEAAVLAQFDHPNVLKLVGVVTVGQPMLVITEYLEYGSMKDYLKKHAPVDTAKRLVLATDVAAGLAYLHGKNFLHRDIAARNILISSEKRGKIADFGLSRDTEENDYYRSKGGALPIRWTSPESLDSRKFDKSSDVWALGITFYELFTDAEIPYKGWQNKKVWVEVMAGYRLPCPQACPQEFYDNILAPCWLVPDTERPSAEILYGRLQNDFVTVAMDANGQPVKPAAAAQRVGGGGGGGAGGVISNDYLEPQRVIGLVGAGSVNDQSHYTYQDQSHYAYQEGPYPSSGASASASAAAGGGVVVGETALGATTTATGTAGEESSAMMAKSVFKSTAAATTTADSSHGRLSEQEQEDGYILPEAVKSGAGVVVGGAYATTLRRHDESEALLEGGGNHAYSNPETLVGVSVEPTERRGQEGAAGEPQYDTGDGQAVYGADGSRLYEVGNASQEQLLQVEEDMVTMYETANSPDDISVQVYDNSLSTTTTTTTTMASRSGSLAKSQRPSLSLLPSGDEPSLADMEYSL